MFRLNRTEVHHVAGYPYEFEVVGDGFAKVPMETLRWCCAEFGEGKIVNFLHSYPRSTDAEYAFCDFLHIRHRFRWIYGLECVWLRDEADAFHFRLRWT